jgi:hypothetical protein
MFKIGDKVRVVKKKNTGAYKNTYNKEGTISYVDYSHYKYGVDLSSITNPNSVYGRFYFAEDELELIAERYIPSFEEIREKKLSCVILAHSKTECRIIQDSSVWNLSFNSESYLDDVYNPVGFSCSNGVFQGYGRAKFYYNNTHEYGEVYNCSDVIRASKVDTSTMCCRTTCKKESSKMNNTFEVTNGIRSRFAGEKTRDKLTKTVTTTVSTFFGTASTTCDKVNYDVYTGALVAAAKITANKSEEAMLIYKTAIDLWGTEMCISILRSLANRAFGATPFENAYKKWRKAVAYEERMRDKRERTCSVCGRIFETVDEARAHEKWHEDCRTRKIERREAKRRLAEVEREGRISDIMVELLEERNKELTAPVNEATTTEQN